MWYCDRCGRPAIMEIRKERGRRGEKVYPIALVAFVSADAIVHREMQVFLVGYLLISLCEIFTVGGIPLDGDVRKVGYSFSGMLTMILTRLGLYGDSSRSRCCDDMDTAP
jgi:hypothetical protein